MPSKKTRSSGESKRSKATTEEAASRKSSPTIRERDAARKAAARAAERDLKIPSVADPQRREELEADDEAWLRFYHPSVFKFPFTSDQSQMVREVGHCLRYGTKKAIAAPRGDGKTSITRYLSEKYMLTRECPFALYVGESDPKAVQSEQAIKRHLRLGCRERDRVFYPITPLGEDYPFECAVAAYVSRAPSRANNVTVNGGLPVHVQWAGDQLVLPSIEAGEADPEEIWERWRLIPGEMGSILVATGITGSLLQGANVFDMRPRIVILDDLDKRGSLAADKSKTATTGIEESKVAAKIEDIIEKTIAGMRGQGERMGQVMLCTVTAKKSIAFRYTDPEEKPSWGGVRNKRIKQWPERQDLWDHYITLRQKGQKERDADGNPKDKTGRAAHRFYLENFDEMNRGAVVDNPNIFDPTELPDGTQTQVSALQWCYDYIADTSEESFRTEYQQEPPEEEGVERLILTAYHVQHSARSGLPQKVVPAETAGVVCGLDIKKIGFHFVVWAYSDTPTRGACIDYGFHEIKFSGPGMHVEDAERAILLGLHEWREERDESPYLDMDGREFLIDLTLIDQGWKHETWASQPADYFCAESGLDRFLPCKGWGDGQYRRPNPSRNIIIGDNCHVSFSGSIPHVNWNTDHWKMKIHEGFLTPPGDAGSLTLFDPSATRGRRAQPHLSFAKHITSHVWEERFVPGYRGKVAKWWKDGAQDHYLDAASQGLVARSLLGATTLTPSTEPPPVNHPPPQSAEPHPGESSDFSERRSW